MDTPAKSKPNPIKPPELILFSENQSSVTYKVNEIDQAVAALFGLADNPATADPTRPALVYVHGRALGHRKNAYDEEPGESRQCCIPELFSRYYVSKVLMFHWPHWGNFNDYNGPAQDARSAGPALGDLLAAIDRAVKDKQPSRPAILITHSMGSIALAEALNRSASLELSGFNTVAVFSSANRYDNSWRWLSRVHSDNRYVFANEHDPVLRNVRDALGECGVNCLNKRQRAEGIVYIDISPLKLGHRYFVFGKLDRKEKGFAKDVVQPILLGEKPRFRGNQPYARKSIYIVRPGN